MYLETTGWVLLFSLIFTYLWSWICFHFYWPSDRTRFFGKASPHLRVKPSTQVSGGVLIFPSLLIAPAFIFFAFHLIGINLIYPPIMQMQSWQSLVRAPLPAMVLCLSSGLLLGITLQVRGEIAFWQAKPFHSFAEASGIDPKSKMQRLILMNTFAKVWSFCLPWFFSELILVEVLFAAPGYGLALWDAAKSRQWQVFGQSIVAFIVLYLLIYALQKSINHWLGRRLEGYV